MLFPDTLDIEAFFKSIGITLTNTELQKIRTEHDKESNKGDNFEYNFENMCKVLFKFTDKNSDGFISAWFKPRRQRFQCGRGAMFGRRPLSTREHEVFLYYRLASGCVTMCNSRWKFSFFSKSTYLFKLCTYRDLRGFNFAI